MDVLICGASARAAAFSALRAGLRPVTFDLFADCDLTPLCPAHRVPAGQYPSALVDLLDSAPPCAWLYTGALENHPDVVHRISERHRLLGNSAATLRTVRDPLRVAAALHDAEFFAPRVSLTPEGLPRDGSWLIKPLASGGGLDIAVFDGVSRPREAVYYQERIEGLSLSAVFLGMPGVAELVGATQQSIGRPGAPFAYVGNVGPWPLLPLERERVEMLGDTIASAFGLVGLFGVDFILRDGHPWTVEINPRYTASVEVLELALGRALLNDHIEAFQLPPSRPHASFPRSAWERPLGRSASFSIGPQSGQECIPTRSVGTRGTAIVGKAVLFAEQPCRFPPADELTRERHGPLTIADIPREGTSFEPGDPVMTVFATGETVAECQAHLERRRQAWLGRLRAS